MAKKSAGGSSGNEASSSEVLSGYSAMHAPKLQLFGVNSRYANALYSVASKEKSLEKVEGELKKMMQMVNEHEGFGEFLKNPTISKFAKKDSMDNIMKEGKFSKPVHGLFSVLSENGRLPIAYEVMDTYMKLMKAYRGEVDAIVTSAQELNKNQLKQVEDSLQRHIESNEKLMLETKVDPAILGGLKVQIGTKFIDLSIASKVDKLHAILATPV